MKINVYISCESKDDIPASDTSLDYHWIDNSKIKSVSDMYRLIKRPFVIVTSGNAFKNPNLNGLSLEFRRRWIHVDLIKNLSRDGIINTMFNAREPIERFASNPLISIITTTYHSGDKLKRVISSLEKQTYTHWEWIIFDDSKDTDNKGATWSQLKQIANNDSRVSIYHSSSNSGIIGRRKREAFMLGRGSYLVEIDHDDEFVPNLFDWIVTSGLKHKAGFVYSDCCEPIEDTDQDFEYGELWGLGYGQYSYKWYGGRWRAVAQGCDLNPITISHIVSCPNHVRAWRRDIYCELGGHSDDLAVADDYDLMVRTYKHSTEIVRICDLGYLQYRNAGGNNFTFIRNAMIQDIVWNLRGHHGLHTDWKREPIWKSPDKLPIARNKFWLPDNINITIIIFGSDDLKNTIQSVLDQTYSNFVLYVIGNKGSYTKSAVNKFITSPKINDIRWFNIDSSKLEDAINYGAKAIARTEWISYLKAGDIWPKNYIESNLSKIKDIGGSDAKRIYIPESKNISGLIHHQELFQTYGYWTENLSIDNWTQST